MGDVIGMKILDGVTVQENGIVRNSQGRLIARLVDDVDFHSEHLGPAPEAGTVGDWIEEAKGIAAHCWLEPETSDLVFDPALAEVIANRAAAWMDTAAQYARNAAYYRGLVERCGEAIGEKAFIADDGGRHEDVLCAKVPELVEGLCKFTLVVRGEHEIVPCEEGEEQQ